MKTLCVLTLILAASWATSPLDIFEQWIKFKADFKKQYATPLEEIKRFKIFQANVAEIEQHNEKYARGEVTYTKGINQFGDKTDEEFMAYLNSGKLLKPKVPGKYGKLFVPSHKKPAAEVDWRDKGVVTEVKSQGGFCQSCWCFSSTGAIEGQLAINGRGLVSLSEQNLIDCTFSYKNKGCNRGVMDYAFNYIHDYGIESEQDYPYEGSDDTCKFNESLSVTKISGYRHIPKGDELALQKAVDQIGPISAGIHATNIFKYYTGGYLYDPTCSSELKKGNHAILIVGYGGNGTHDYWIVKNSFGTRWGDSGYAYLARNAGNNCGIATHALYPVL